MAKTPVEKIVQIELLERATTELWILGTSPLVMNRMPKKAREQLLLPPLAANRAARSAVLKHSPPDEFREAVYMSRDAKAPTAIHIPGNAIKKAMAFAALDTPGAKKSEIGRLVQVIDPTVHLYGTPMLFMSVVRQAGINRTPDIRTRAIFPSWCCKITIQFIRNVLREKDIVNCLANAGLIIGIGDGRSEKGTFDYGCFEIVGAEDPRVLDLIKHHARPSQLAALASPQAVDEDSEELLAYFESEIVRREKRPSPVGELVAAAAANGKRKSNCKTRKVGEQ